MLSGPPYPDSVEEWATLHKIENLNMWSIKTKDIPYYKLTRIYSSWNFIDYILTRLHIFPEIQTFSMRAFFAIKKLLKNNTYDIIHDVNTLGWGLMPTRYFGLPVISTIHHPLTRDRDADLAMDRSLWDKLTTLLFYPTGMQKKVVNSIDHVVTSFKEGVAELHNAFGVKSDRVSVVYNGMDVNLFQNTGEKRENYSLLFVGNTEDYKKGLIYLLQALAMLPEKITLTVVDDGPPQKLTAAKMVEKLNLEGRVVFTGKVDFATLVSLYSRKTILVMPSLYEGFGLPAAEAMACKTPVVVTTAGALKEVVSEETGLLVPPQEPRKLADAILTLIKDKKMQKKMGQNGRQRVVNNFSWPIAAHNTLEVYKKVIKEFRGAK